MRGIGYSGADGDGECNRLFAPTTGGVSILPVTVFPATMSEIAAYIKRDWMIPDGNQAFGQRFWAYESCPVPFLLDIGALELRAALSQSGHFFYPLDRHLDRDMGVRVHASSGCSYAWFEVVDNSRLPATCELSSGLVCPQCLVSMRSKCAYSEPIRSRAVRNPRRSRSQLPPKQLPDSARPLDNCR